MSSQRGQTLPSLGGVCALVGENLEPLFECEIVWKGDKIVSIEGKKEGKFEGRVVLPSFVNAHTHIGDSIAKEAYVGLTLEQTVDPHTGLKTKILQSSTKKELVSAMRKALKQCVALGVTHVLDFREGGVEGLKLAKAACEGIDVQLALFGRLSKPPSKQRVLSNERFSEAELEELHKVCEAAHGIGVSGANEYSDRMLEQIREVAKAHGKLVAVHCLESKNTRNRLKQVFGKDEFQRCVAFLKPDIFVHMTCATRKELALASKTATLVCCPRSNAALANGFPPLREVLKHKGALGTDNVMVNSVDMFREMEFAYKILVGLTKKPFDDVKSVLKAATLNARPLLRLKPLCVDGDANFVLLNLKKLKPFWNLHAAIVNRAQEENVEMVVKQGLVVKSLIRQDALTA